MSSDAKVLVLRHYITECVSCSCLLDYMITWLQITLITLIKWRADRCLQMVTLLILDKKYKDEGGIVRGMNEVSSMDSMITTDDDDDNTYLKYHLAIIIPVCIIIIIIIIIIIVNISNYELIFVLNNIYISLWNLIWFYRNTKLINVMNYYLLLLLLLSLSLSLLLLLLLLLLILLSHHT